MTILGSFPIMPPESPIKELRRQLDALPLEQRIPEALKAAAELVEYAAYEMAQSSNASDTTTLILLAADLERRSVQMQKPLS